MIPLSVFLAVWAFLLLVWAVFSVISVSQMLRFAVSGSMAYLSTALFITVSVLALFLVGAYLLTVDWSLGLNFGGIQTGIPGISL